MSTLKPVGAFSLLCVACLTIMVGCVIVPGLTSIASGLGVTGSASWLVTLPSLGVVLFGPIAGSIIIHKGPRFSLRSGLALYGLIGIAGALPLGSIYTYIDRLILGGATALVMASGTSLISEFYNGHARLKMMARQGMSIELGGVIFLFIGGVLAEMGWRWPFLLYLVSWVFLAMIARFIPAESPTHQAKDTHTEHHGNAARGATAKVLPVYLAALLSMTIFFAAIITLPHRLHAMGFTESETGYLLSFVSLIAVAGASTLPKLIVRIGEYSTLVIGFFCYAAAHITFSSTQHIEVIIAGSFMLGLGFGLTIPLVNHMAVERSHPRIRGKNLAYLSMSIFLGQFLSSFFDYVPGGAQQIFKDAAVLATVGVVIFSARVLQKKSIKT
ncbi:MFS transporter [Pseudomonas sp. MWU12-2037]|uniref:MFS transporter n=1 Tax=Pseudomonas sp. MWU12-2037 TaxID=2928690 RepID=UPI00200DEE51|nr:MFS transporter [Pseudomonas sp. MWU12-2037]